MLRIVTTPAIDCFGEDDSPYRILVVDDCPENVDLLEGYLGAAGWSITAVPNGRRAISEVQNHPPDVVIMDVMMPDLDGYEVCRILKQDPLTRLIPIVLLTALNDMNDRLVGLEAGADEFLSKPFNRIELTTRIRNLARVKRLNDQLESAENVLTALATAIEAKDLSTEGHVERVSWLAERLGQRLGLPNRERETLAKAGILHDVGKIGVRESILMKPGSLTPEETREMQMHSILGEKICQPLRSAAHLLAAIRHHHERIDGTGYPDGLAGESIPAVARILAIADSYDAMTSDRPYRAAMLPATALQVLRDGAGRQWDAQMVEAFAAMVEEDGFGIALPFVAPKAPATKPRRPVSEKEPVARSIV